MPEPRPGQPGKYLYAVAPAAWRQRVCSEGIYGAPVYLLPAGLVAAVVSDISLQKLRPERRHLAAHHAVLKHLMEVDTVLPASFGVIASNARALQKVLERHQEALLEQLERVKGKVEMGLRISWEVPDLFAHLIRSSPDLRGARDRCFLGSGKPSRQEMIEIGRMFDQILGGYRGELTERVERFLAGRCSEIKRNPPRREKEVANLACLVARQRVEAFEEGVRDAARLFDENFALSYNGPWAPHHFVDMLLDV